MYLEGLCAAHATSISAAAAPTGPQPSTPKKRRLFAANVVKELTDAKALKDASVFIYMFIHVNVYTCGSAV